VYCLLKHFTSTFYAKHSVLIKKQSCKRSSFWSPNTTRTRHPFLQPDLGPKNKFTECIKICATAFYQKTLRTGIASVGYIFCHTQNSNHLDQNIDINKFKLSLLVNDNSAECNVSQEERSYPEIIHHGAIGVKETIRDSAIGMKSQFVGQRLLKQPRNQIGDWSFRNNTIAC